jgi:hypothetical protein
MSAFAMKSMGRGAAIGKIMRSEFRNKAQVRTLIDVFLVEKFHYAL